VRLIVELCLVLPEVPENVNTSVSRFAEAAAFNVIVEEPEPLMVTGLKVAVTPGGRPLTDSVIAGGIEPDARVCTM
jgi:hypothetical protein